MDKHTIINTVHERGIVVSLVNQNNQSFDPEYTLQELVRLAETAGVEIVETMMQKKDARDAKWFIGKGKVEELKQRLAEVEGNVAIFNQELSGMQVRNLEATLEVKIIDRTQLILDIFAQRAHTREGKLQVELAQLNYLLPRLSGHGVNLSRLGGGIGTRGPGETKLETDRRHIRNRIHDLKSQLKEVVKHRQLHRERRKKTGVYQVALVGYTNAGKSTLLNRLTGADSYVEDQLFATLDPTSRSLELSGELSVMLTDTVGFIQELPHDLVAAFRATLEDVREADLILHVVDASSEMHKEQINTVNQVLEELGAHQKEQILIFNKMDLYSGSSHEIVSAQDSFIRVSAFNSVDLDKVKLMIQKKLMGDVHIFKIPADQGDMIALSYRVGEVLEQTIDEDSVILKVRTNIKEYARLGHILDKYKGGQL